MYEKICQVYVKYPTINWYILHDLKCKFFVKIGSFFVKFMLLILLNFSESDHKISKIYV